MSSVLLKREIWTLQNKRASENLLQKIVQENKFPELTTKRAKLKIKKFVLQILLS